MIEFTDEEGNVVMVWKDGESKPKEIEYKIGQCKDSSCRGYTNNVNDSFCIRCSRLLKIQGAK